jgi:hypothetical protein
MTIRTEANRPVWQRLLSSGLLTLTFAAYSGGRVPVPGINEPHYLVKARHYWQPDWCAGDLFLQSSNPHQFFFQTIGWLTAVLSFEAAAWIGRLLALAVLAIGWDRLISRMTPGFLGPTLAAWLFLLLQTLGNFSGEWLVGGVESKVFSYGLVLWAGGCLLDARPIRGAFLLGLATSFHPVVGAWCAVLTGATIVWKHYGRRLGGRLVADWKTPNLPYHEGPDLEPASIAAAPAPTVRVGRWFLPTACCVAAALPGVIPAAAVLLQADQSLAVRADLIQVGYRLVHHLDPLDFPLEAYRYYGLLLVIWFLLLHPRDDPPNLRWLQWFTLAAIGLCVVGWLMAAGPRPLNEMPLYAARIRFLKLYPFRVADLAVPLSVAVTAVVAADRKLRTAGTTRWLRRGLHSAFAAAFGLAVTLPGADRNPSRMSDATYTDWLEACRWLRDQTPQDALVYAPNEDWAIKWYAERAEYVNFKDCPQDAARIVAWYDRQVRLSQWSRENYVDRQFSADELQALHRLTGITHLVVSRFGPIDMAPVHENTSFRIYDIRPQE